MFSNRLKILDDFGIVAIAAAVIGATRALTLKKGYLSYIVVEYPQQDQQRR